MTKMTGIIADGKARWKRSPRHRRKVVEVKKGITADYAILIRKEKNWVKRLWLKARCALEIRKQIAQLSSDRNLHIFG